MIKITDTLEFGNTLELAFGRVAPAVIRTAEQLGIAAGSGLNGSSMMSADVVKRSQNIIFAAHDHERFAGNRRREKIARFFDLCHATHHLPRCAEDVFALKLGNPLV